ncbi:Crp/Fnr family transcriptional regulator [Puia dinghuensis]|nr:Crp/Fnr family transcriptional regulator [Puia dinghuensis]
MDEFLVYLNIIKPMSPALVDRIRKTFKLRKFNKATYLMRNGENQDRALFVLNGLIRCFSLEGGAEVSKFFLQQYDALDAGIIHPGGISSFEYMQAIVDSLVLTCSKQELDQVYSDYPEFERHGRIIAQRCFSRIYAVLNCIRMHTARERYLFLRREFPDLIETVPDTYLASYVGIHPVTLSRIRQNL